MNLKNLNYYSINDLATASVKAELADIFKATDPFDISCSYGLDLHDPAGSFAAMPIHPEHVNNLRVYHCCFQPNESYLNNGPTYDQLCSEIASELASACYEIALGSPIAFAIHTYEGYRIDVIFSNANVVEGAIDDYNLNSLIYGVRDIA